MSEEKKMEEVKFHFIKSNFFRVIHADGVAGGISPKGTIQLSFFNERSAIPQVTVHKMSLGPGGTMTQGEEVIAKREGREGIVREVETEIVMTEDVAEAFSKWLEGTLKQLREFRGKQDVSNSKQ